MNEETEYKTQENPRLKIKLIKGQKSNYGWEITATPEATPADVSKTLDTIKETDKFLREVYKGE